MANILKKYFEISLIIKLFSAFIVGSLIGGLLWFIAGRYNIQLSAPLNSYVSPFGTVFVHMLKMVVYPIVFFSLISGAANLPTKRFGKIGIKIILLYMLTSLMAAIVGVIIALIVNPGASGAVDWTAMVAQHGDKIANVTAANSGNLTDIFVNMFANPFQALATGNFLPMIVFAILFGLALSILREDASEGDNCTKSETKKYQVLLDGLDAINQAMHKIVGWIMEYAPIGVFALSIVNFALYGPQIIGPYVKVVLGIILGILVMIFVVYSTILKLFAKQSPIAFFKNIKEAMLTAFVTRSSAATLPISMKVAEEQLKVKKEISSFSLPLGATINMDGVCVHLPMFAVLTANMFGIELTSTGLFTLVITTVLAAVGAGGVPGGSLMLLFIILESMGISEANTAVVVTLALGVNPILDMFETMNNVAGDITCTYIVASNEGLIEKDPEITPKKI